MKNYEKFLNKYKINLLTNLEKKKHFLIYVKYNHFNFLKIKVLKKTIPNINIRILKKNIFIKYNFNYPLNKGPICLIITENLYFLDVYHKLLKNKNLKILLLSYNNKIYSNIKLKTILKEASFLLKIKEPVMILKNILKNIK